MTFISTASVVMTDTNRTIATTRLQKVVVAIVLLVSDISDQIMKLQKNYSIVLIQYLVYQKKTEKYEFN